MEVVLSIMVPLVVLGLVIAGVVYAIQRVRRGEGVSLSLRQVLAFYFYVMTVVTLLVAFSGLSRLVQAGLAVPLGREFSYYPVYYPDYYPVPMRIEAPPAPAPAVPPTVAPPQKGPSPEEEARRQKGLDQALKEGILGGLNFTVVGGLFWLVHQWGRRRFGQNGDMLENLYLIGLLSVFAGLTLYSLPSGINETLRYYLLDGGQGSNPPGGRLATAIVALPLWLLYLSATLRRLKASRATPA
ncbi:MAG: hypothetical protein KJ624_03000 [Chloroflexi bacterium]|nr:hypothetical protein [Chloroflexota bacterium]